MNLDDLKKASEIFENFAQPIATVIAANISVKLIKNKSDNKEKRKD